MLVVNASEARTVIVSVPFPAILVDVDGKIISMNDRALEDLGLKPSDEGHRLGSVLAEGSDDAVGKVLEALRKGAPLPGDAVIGSPRNKKERYVLSGTPVRDERDTAGSIIYLTPQETCGEDGLTASDLRYENKRLATLLANLPGMAYRCKLDENWTMEFISDGCMELTGHAVSDLLGNKVIAYGNVIIPEDQDKVTDAVMGAVTKKQRYSTNYRIRTKEGELKYVWEKGMPIVSEDGTPIAVEGYIMDVTASARVEQFSNVEVARLAKSLSQLAEGELDLDMTVAEGDQHTVGAKERYSIINQNLRKARDSIRMLVDEAHALSGSAIRGELSARADVMKLNGEFRNIVQGVNSTLDAVTVPINEAMRIADSYANGDLTARVEIETQGDFTKFAGSLNTIGESLTTLLREVNRSVNMVSATSQELASSAEEMNASTEQVSAAIQQISKGAQNQATQVDETAKIMAGISTAVSQLSDSINVNVEGAKRGADSAERGKAAVVNTVRKMDEISAVVDESAKVIEILGKRSEEIGEIVGVITGISEQTNLLALNAAIEAARAGEQGRGFAVVAEEVKNLAEDSREAAERIAKMIREVQQETNKAVHSMKLGTKTAAEGRSVVEETGRVFEEISDVVGGSARNMSSMVSLMGSQKEGTQAAAKSVDGIASIAEETASASEESAASTQELTASMQDMTARAQSLSEMAINLQKVAARFKIDAEEGEAKVPVKAAKVAKEGAARARSKPSGAVPAHGHTVAAKRTAAQKG